MLRQQRVDRDRRRGGRDLADVASREGDGSPSPARWWTRGGDRELNVEHEGRFELWQMANLMIHDHPFFGVGLNMFDSNLRGYGYQGRRLRSTHNIYLQLSVEQGIPCAVGHVLLLLTLMWISPSRRARSSGTVRADHRAGVVRHGRGIRGRLVLRRRFLREQPLGPVLPSWLESWSTCATRWPACASPRRLAP